MAAGRGGGCDAVQWRPGRLEALQLLLTFSPASTRQQTAVKIISYLENCVMVGPGMVIKLDQVATVEIFHHLMGTYSFH